jgi:hypothetical protein
MTILGIDQEILFGWQWGVDRVRNSDVQASRRVRISRRPVFYGDPGCVVCYESPKHLCGVWCGSVVAWSAAARSSLLRRFGVIGTWHSREDERGSACPPSEFERVLPN